MRPLISILFCLLLGACATRSEGKLPVCDGNHRRPANPFSSVLLPKDGAAVSPSATSTAPGKVSALSYSGGNCA